MIRGITGRGSVVALDSGGVYEVEPDDTPDTALWNAGDHALVCGDEKMINKDNGDKAHVTPARLKTIGVWSRRLVGTLTPRRPHSGGIAGLALLALLCFDYYSIVKEPSGSATFATFAPRQPRALIALMTQRPNQCHPISIWA